MALSREEIAAAEKMHRFVASWEKHHPSALRSMWIALPIALSSVVRSFHERTHTFGYVFLGIWLVMMVAFFFIDRFQRARYARERLIVQALERDHAEETAVDSGSAAGTAGQGTPCRRAADPAGTRARPRVNTLASPTQRR